MSSDFFVTYVPDRSTCTYVRRVCDLSAVASNCSARTIEQPEINEFAHCLVASRIGVRPVAVPCRRHCRSRTAIGQSHDGTIFHERVEVDHTVEVRLRADPFVQRKPLRFVGRGPAGPRGRSATRDHRGADDLDSPGAHQGYDLLRSSNYLCCGEVAGYVVRAHEEYDVRNAGTVENIPLQTLEPRGTVTPTQHTVPGDRRDRDGLLLPFRPRGEPRRKHVAPTLVEIGLHDPFVIARAAAAVRNPGGENDDGPSGFRRVHVQCRDPVERPLPGVEGRDLRGRLEARCGRI